MLHFVVLFYWHEMNNQRLLITNGLI